MKITDLPTPSLILDRAVLRANLKRMADHIAAKGGVLRPHVKTHKSAEVQAELKRAGAMRGITVSTLAEANYFFDAGERDILYAVGIVPHKLPALADLMRRGAEMTIILDSIEAARAVSAAGVEAGLDFQVLIELDVDGARAGIAPDSPVLLEIAAALTAPGTDQGATLRGVMTHAGGSYGCPDTEAITALARRERDLAVFAAERLRQAGHPIDTISIGSTPTAVFAASLEGVTEVRAGVYVFHDLVMMQLGVCREADIALSVLGSVIGHQEAKGWTLTDAGWMAMSRDLGLTGRGADYGYGAVRGLDGEDLGGLVLSGANQEHGIITAMEGDESPHLALGEKIRILPNHACATAAQFDAYQLVEDGQVIGRWTRERGW